MVAKKKQAGIRLDDDLILRLDAYAHARARAEAVPGPSVTRSDAIRALLEQGLAEAGFASEGPKKIDVRFHVTCTVEVDEEVLKEATSKEWASSFYKFETEQAVAEHLAYNMLRGTSMSCLDGFAHWGDDKAKVTNESWDPE